MHRTAAIGDVYGVAQRNLLQAERDAVELGDGDGVGAIGLVNKHVGRIAVLETDFLDGIHVVLVNH